MVCVLSFGVIVAAAFDGIFPVTFEPFTYAVFPDRIFSAAAVPSDVSTTED